RDAVEEGTEAGRAARHVRRALKGERDIRRGERRSVLEGDAGTKIEFPARRIERLPRGGEAGMQLAIAPHADQRLEDLEGQVEVATEPVEMWIDRIRFHRDADGKIGRARRIGAGDAEKAE